MPWKSVKKGQLKFHNGWKARVSVEWPTEALPDRGRANPRRLVEGVLRGTRLVSGGLEVALMKKEFQDIEVWHE